jgi:DNA-binding response OmpR family regulator
MLESGEYNVLLAHGGAAALCMVERKDLTIDLMLLDAAMPDTAGPGLPKASWPMCANLTVSQLSP